MNVTIDRLPIANGVGASWFEDLSPAFLDECVSLRIAVVGCTANEAWDDTLESIENLQTVKQTVKGHERTYIIETGDDLEKGLARNDVGVILGFQNPKALSDSMNFLETFADMGLRCCAPAFRENSYYGCGFSSALDSGLSQVGERVVRVMNRRGIVIDLSHVGDNTAIDAVELSEHPVIFSHSVSRTLMEAGPKIESAGVKNSAVRRAAPDELVLAAAKKGGVICPDARIAGSLTNFLKHIEYLAGLVGTDHVGLTAQDDWHRSEKDVRRIQPYLPGYDSKAGKNERRSARSIASIAWRISSGRQCSAGPSSLPSSRRDTPKRTSSRLPAETCCAFFERYCPAETSLDQLRRSRIEEQKSVRKGDHDEITARIIRCVPFCRRRGSAIPARPPSSADVNCSRPNRRSITAGAMRPGSGITGSSVKSIASTTRSCARPRREARTDDPPARSVGMRSDFDPYPPGYGLFVFPNPSMHAGVDDVGTIGWQSRGSDGRHQGDRPRDREAFCRKGSGKGGVQSRRPRGEPGGRGQACRRRDRDIVSALSDQRGPIRGGLPARGGTACPKHLVETKIAPVEALRSWLQAGVEFIATKKGMAAALAMAAHGSSELVAYSLDRLTGAVGRLLQRAAAAGEVRADIDPEDLLRTLVGMCYAHDGTAWQPKVVRLVDVFIGVGRSCLLSGRRRSPSGSASRSHPRIQICAMPPSALASACSGRLSGSAPLRLGEVT